MFYKYEKQYRYKGYNYAENGFYFVTICTKNREIFFGNIIKTLDNVFVELSKIGKMVKKYWLEIPKHFPFVELDEFIIMPNHIHGIILINKNVGTQNVGTRRNAKFCVPTDVFLREYRNEFGPQSKNLSSIIRGFKIGATKYAKNNNIIFGWQPRFHDRIIRNDEELNRIRQYIIDNPLKWEIDRNYVEG